MNPPARARPRGFTSDLSTADTVRRSICTTAFRDPASVESVRRHRVARGFVVAPHAHADLLQLDVVCGCGGEVTLGQRRAAVSGTTAMLTPPGTRHGYRLRPPAHRGLGSGVVYHLKLRVDRGWIDRPPGPLPLPGLLTELPPLRALTEGLDRFADAWSERGVPFESLAGLVEAVAAWPASAASAGLDASAPARVGTVAERVRAVIDGASDRHGEPPPLEDLAAAAHLSPRHFSRVFSAAYGCTPHQYLHARRLEVAKGLLLGGTMRVGEVADDLGFSSAAAFSRWFQRLAGRSPREFRGDPGVF